MLLRLVARQHDDFRRITRAAAEKPPQQHLAQGTGAAGDQYPLAIEHVHSPTSSGHWAIFRLRHRRSDLRASPRSSTATTPAQTRCAHETGYCPAGDFPSNNRRTDGQTARPTDLAEKFRSPIEILGIGGIALAIGSASAGKDAVGTEMHKPRAALLTQPSEKVGKQRIDRDRRGRVLRRLALFHNADAIDDRVRPRLVEGTSDRPEILDRNPETQICPCQGRSRRVRLPRSAQGADRFAIPGEPLEDLVAEHAARAEHQHSHHPTVLRPVIWSGTKRPTVPMRGSAAA